MRAAVVVLVLCAASIARAEPTLPSSCRELRALPFAKLSTVARDKVPNGGDWSLGHDATFTRLLVTVTILRGPQLVREILMACPDVLEITEVQSFDARHFSSSVTLRAKSFAAIARIAQLPAVVYVNIDDPTAIRPAIPEPARPFR